MLGTNGVVERLNESSGFYLAVATQSMIVKKVPVISFYHVSIIWTTDIGLFISFTEVCEEQKIFTACMPSCLRVIS